MLPEYSCREPKFLTPLLPLSRQRRLKLDGEKPSRIHRCCGLLLNPVTLCLCPENMIGIERAREGGLGEPSNAATLLCKGEGARPERLELGRPLRFDARLRAKLESPSGTVNPPSSTSPHRGYYVLVPRDSSRYII